MNNVLIFSANMVNRVCDFCCNQYRRNPEAGYYRVTQAMRRALGLLESVQLDFICGLHFRPECFLDDGRLKQSSVPSFFPRLSSAEHDHNYHKSEISDPAEYDGGEVVC